MLVLASYLFYSTAEAWYCLLLFSSTLIDFLLAQRIAATSVHRHRLAWLRLSLVLNIGILAIFKYADFGVDNLNLLLDYFGISTLPGVDLILPIGISFYTFQTLSYTIDVYRGEAEPSRDFIGFALYVAYFPQLVAGPIERVKKLLPQFERKPVVGWEDLQQGFQRILWGLSKKLIFADRLAVTVDAVFANPAGYSSLEIMLAVVAFSFQLYLDFSAYVDIAIGLARMMGVRLSENFNYPFLAKNTAEFWTRWHITLSNWFRDYLFRALGGNRRSRPYASMLALLFVMTTMGLWHGAAWNFVLFGFVSAIQVIIYTQIRTARGRGRLLGSYWWSVPLAMIIMFVLINFNMLIFRADSMSNIWQLVNGIAVWDMSWRHQFDVALLLVLIAALLHILRGSYPVHFRQLQLSPFIRAGFWLGMLLLIHFLRLDQAERFIYFQF